MSVPVTHGKASTSVKSTRGAGFDNEGLIERNFGALGALIEEKLGWQVMWVATC